MEENFIKIKTHTKQTRHLHNTDSRTERLRQFAGELIVVERHIIETLGPSETRNGTRQFVVSKVSAIIPLENDLRG